jgi:putative addiction module CopG family antidote
MTITLSSAQAEFIEAEVASGRFADRSAVVDAALISFEEARKQFFEELDRGIADLDAGRSSSITPLEILEEIRNERVR